MSSTNALNGGPLPSRGPMRQPIPDWPKVQKGDSNCEESGRRGTSTSSPSSMAVEPATWANVSGAGRSCATARGGRRGRGERARLREGAGAGGAADGRGRACGARGAPRAGKATVIGSVASCPARLLRVSVEAPNGVRGAQSPGAVCPGGRRRRCGGDVRSGRTRPDTRMKIGKKNCEQYNKLTNRYLA